MEEWGNGGGVDVCGERESAPGGLVRAGGEGVEIGRVRKEEGGGRGVGGVIPRRSVREGWGSGLQV